MNKPRREGLFEGAPIDDYILKALVTIASDTTKPALERLALMVVEFIRVEGVEEMERRGMLKKTLPPSKSD